MQNIHISELRVDGFRGLKDFKLPLSETTLLTGVNNAGKTTVLKALQLLFGDSSFLTTTDLHIEGSKRSSHIIVDAKIIAIDEKGERIPNFSQEWVYALNESYMKVEKIGDENYSYLPLRVKYTFQSHLNSFSKETQALEAWDIAGVEYKDLEYKKYILNPECFQFHYIDEKRDIVEDLKNRTSYILRLLGDVVSYFNSEVATDLRNKICSFNTEIVEKNRILRSIQENLKALDSSIDSSGKVSFSPLAPNLQDLITNSTILFGTTDNSFTMDYHGMGTRSWSSLLSFKTFIEKVYNGRGSRDVFLPIIAIEEPDAHLHSHAQRRLYKQMSQLPGLKVISTHSHYVAASAELSELRGLYKTNNATCCGALPIDNLSKEDRRKIKQAVLSNNGEILFAKAIVLCEGETEVQALPIFYEKHFGERPFNAGISFVDAKGYGNYYPFIVIASAFHIPWYIFSDGEKSTMNGLNKLLKKVYGIDKELADQKNIFIIPKGNDFEGMLLQDGYKDEIEEALEELLEEDDVVVKFIKNYNHKTKGREKTEKRCPTCNQNIYEDIERVYDGEEGRLKALDDIMEKYKAQLGPILATCINESDKPLPTLVVEMFKRIKEDIGDV